MYLLIAVGHNLNGLFALAIPEKEKHQLISIVFFLPSLMDVNLSDIHQTQTRK